MIKAYKIHEVAALFPIMEGIELQKLADDIKEHGLQQPIVVQGECLLDGRNRLAACELVGVEPKYIEYSGDNLLAYVISANLHRRHLTTNQKAELADKLLPFFEAEAKKRQGQRNDLINIVAPVPGSSNEHKEERARDAVAALVGISGRTVSDMEFVKKHNPELHKKLLEPKTKLSIKKATSIIKNEQQEKVDKIEHAKITVAAKKSIEDICDLRVCRCKELLASGIKIDAVICDPPYIKESLDTFSELALACKEAKIPLVAVMSGQYHLPEVMQRLCEHLKYRWILCYLTPGTATQVIAAKINSNWKPVLLFGGIETLGSDVFKSDANDKRFHHWGQSESGMADLVERLTRPGQTVCDPFLGGGTTAVVSLQLGRKFIGCDIDAIAVATAKKRIELTLCKGK